MVIGILRRRYLVVIGVVVVVSIRVAITISIERRGIDIRLLKVVVGSIERVVGHIMRKIIVRRRVALRGIVWYMRIVARITGIVGIIAVWMTGRHVVL